MFFELEVNEIGITVDASEDTSVWANLIAVIVDLFLPKYGMAASAGKVHHRSCLILPFWLEMRLVRGLGLFI